ncbi:MAG: hypothetical protein NC924_03055 [Candidatus Omnitrophica bacterium]|nr:hypothetical protein [Candidatus Omnitrophota bacterium]
MSGRDDGKQWKNVSAAGSFINTTFTCQDDAALVPPKAGELTLKGSDRLCSAVSGKAQPVAARAMLLQMALCGTKRHLRIRKEILPDSYV